VTEVDFGVHRQRSRDQSYRQPEARRSAAEKKEKTKVKKKQKNQWVLQENLFLGP